MAKHVVEQGECIFSIAAGYGFFWETIWKDSANAGLKNLRKDPSVLFAGDEVAIPEKRVKEIPGATEQRHRFRLKGVPAKVRARVLFDDVPRANEPCQININGQWQKASTDANGYLEFPIPPSAEEATIIMGKGDHQDRFKLRLGHVDPMDTESGPASRLHNLGYVTTDLPSAIKSFQAKEGLAVTGILDSSTSAKLKERFGQ